MLVVEFHSHMIAEWGKPHWSPGAIRLSPGDLADCPLSWSKFQLPSSQWLILAGPAVTAWRGSDELGGPDDHRGPVWSLGCQECSSDVSGLP